MGNDQPELSPEQRAKLKAQREKLKAEWLAELKDELKQDAEKEKDQNLAYIAGHGCTVFICVGLGVAVAFLEPVWGIFVTLWLLECVYRPARPAEGDQEDE